jgi:hypothetical protein
MSNNKTTSKSSKKQKTVIESNDDKYHYSTELSGPLSFFSAITLMDIQLKHEYTDMLTAPKERQSYPKNPNKYNLRNMELLYELKENDKKEKAYIYTTKDEKKYVHVYQFKVYPEVNRKRKKETIIPVTVIPR